MALRSSITARQWADRLSRSSYFFGALLLHLIVFFMVATWVIFPAFTPPKEEFGKTFLGPSSPHPLPPPVIQPDVELPIRAVSTPVAPIVSPAMTSPTFVVPMPSIVAPMQAATLPHAAAPAPPPKPNTLTPERLKQIHDMQIKNWGRPKNNILDHPGDPKSVIATFPVYLASYAKGDWGCNVVLNGGKVVSGSLPNLVAKMNEWGKGNLTGQVMPIPLDVGTPELMEKKPPFIFFTGHADFKLTDQEIQNLRDYLQVGGCIWGDNALPGRGSDFDVAFRREMKLVVPDKDKNFEMVPPTSDIFTKSWFNNLQLPQGMNYYNEPVEHLDIDGKLAILYTPNDYSDMFTMRILPDGTMGPLQTSIKYTSPLITTRMFWDNRNIFFRNYELPSCLACDQFGMNVIGYLLVRFDKDLLLTP